MYALLPEDLQLFATFDCLGPNQYVTRYISVLFELILYPLIHYGIGLQAHGQNVVVRLCLRTKDIKGFAFRDFGSTRLHKRTLQAMRWDLSAIPSNSATITDDLRAVWNKVHHSLLQSHIGNSLHALGLETEGGWRIVREELSKALCSHNQGRTIYDYFLSETTSFKCFLRMRLAGKYRDVSFQAHTLYYSH
jgi:siderophore synthetase component